MPRTAAAKKPAAKARRAPAKKAYAPRARAAPRAAPARQPRSKFDYSRAGGGIGGILGSVLGGPGGGAIGSALGTLGGAALTKIMGTGDYQVSNIGRVSHNSIVLSNASNIPMFGGGKVAVNIKHREFLGDVISSSSAGAFSIKSYSINPGLPQSFPWLANVCGASFQQYRINGAVYEFRSMSSDALNSTNTALGSVVMATDYDSKDTVFGTKQQMENTEFGVSCKPSCNMLHALECARNQTSVSELYIRAGAVPSGADVRLYDLGRFSIATVGCQGTSVNLGELWVSYDIDLFKAIEQPPGYLVLSAEYSNTPAGGSFDTHPISTTALGYGDNIGLTFTSNKIQWPYDIQNGSAWMVAMTWAGNSTACTPGAVTAGNGMSVTDNFNQAANSTSPKLITVVFLLYDGTGTPAALPYVNFANGTYPATAVVSEINVTQVNPNIL
nr:putative capsid protein [Crucivirus sp.]